jgi:hypothetical protein
VVSIEIAADVRLQWQGGNLEGIRGAPRYTSRVPFSTLVWRTALGEHMSMSENQPQQKRGRSYCGPHSAGTAEGFSYIAG